ncbi:beta-L-arabinofuranosidase domain-containing protein [Streptomyces formicae]|uniref:Glycoside hydrolase family 127 protein n=1 Tax=Streptomyces formicae TaxID=1616117 RepID=A0ABY3WMW6_9ACTN|nr:beta-L-arabinofuranosidase domain-containing protein [Streptomyces formicae]UNM12926.1 glycoside hydrolase family 127 protein [Streptomyces formicae]
MPTIPATLLLEDRAEQAMNAVVGLADPDLGHIPFFSADLLAEPATLVHGDWDYGSSHGRLTDACILARHMTGKSWWSQTEERYKATLLDLLAEDGLTYRRSHPRGHWAPHANLIDQRATLLALTTWYLDSGDETVRRAADRQVAALKRIAVKERDVWYYPASEYTPDGGWPSGHAVQLHLAPDPASFCGRLIMPLLRHHRATGSADALELCGWFTRLITEKSGVFLPDGSFNAALAYRSGHFHTRLGTLDGLAKYAVFTGDHALTAFVKRSFDWALTQCTRFGWTPGDLADQRYEHETCSLVDLIGIGSTLARAGHSAYWSVVERFLRNHLAASQLSDVDWVRSAPDRSRDVPGWRTHYRVGERVRGAFAGYGAPNDYVSDVILGRGHTSDVQACCVGSGVRGLFTGWNAAVTGDEELLRVNLLLNRGSRLVDVLSHLPYEGRVDLDVHADCRELRLRIPDWAGYAHLTVVRQPVTGPLVTTSGRDTGAWAPDGYLRLARPRAGERITVTFPLAESTTDETAAGRTFRTRWRGDDVVGIQPEGRSRPMYSSRQLEPKAPERTHTLAVPTEEWSW